MCKEFRDWPPCGGCGGAVSVEDGILSVDHDAADEVLRAYANSSGPLGIHEFASLPAQVEWRWSHVECNPRPSKFWIDAAELDSTIKVLNWTLHLQEKPWYPVTDWPKVVSQLLDLKDA